LFFWHFVALYLRDASPDRRETFTYNWKCRHLDNVDPKFGTCCLVAQCLEGWIRDREVASNKVNSAFHPSGVGKSSTGLHGWG